MSATSASLDADSRAPARIGVDRIVSPRAVAVLGASDDLKKFGGRIIHYLVRNGYGGRIVPVNPKRETIAGLPTAKSIADAGDIDVAILALPADMAVQAIAECAQAGVGACVIVSTGFAESGEEGAARQRELIAIARRSGMRLVGPNCMGIINPHRRMALTSSLVVAEGELVPGTVGLISQSGALMVSMYDRARQDGVSFSSCISLGNQSDLEICDFFESMIDDAATRVITMYVEGFVDPKRFAQLARRAQAAGKPVLLTKTGRTEAGVAAARSHTASLAGRYEVLEAVCAECGVTLLDDPDGMLQLAAVISRFGPARSRRVGLISPSGGAIGIAVDRLSEIGVTLGEVGAGAQAMLDSVMSPGRGVNPIDLGLRTGDGMEQIRTVVEAFVESPDIGIVFIALTTSPFFSDVARAMGEVAAAARKPVVFLVTPGASADGPRQVLAQLGLPFVNRMDEAIRIIRTYPVEKPPAEGDAGRPAGLPDVNASLAMLGGHPTEPEVKKLLRAYGIPVAAERFCATADAAACAAKEIGFPVVLKAVSRQLVHKSDIGAVKLRLADEAAVRAAWGEIEAALGTHVPGAKLDGCLVAEMVSADRELLVGAVTDEQFGPMIMVGFGGVTVELMPDTQLAVAPVSPAQAEAMLRRLRQWPLLDGYRGARRADVAAISRAISAASWLIADLHHRLAELDINPLLVRSRDGSPVAVDARAALFDRT